jgi:glutamate formiminotransferase/formiminotetrahydrofolate cyclodeaminase
MTAALVECVPNFSEGRRLDVVEQIVAVIKTTPEVILLDYSSDADHNRSVVTFVGTVKGVEEAAFAAIKKASELINLDEHQGEHPRIGATDVVPFIPISGVTMQDCVEIANRLGKRVGENLKIPVYLYEKAATRPEFENLANVRKGEYEGLKQEIQTNPDREPDFGPLELGTAGATVIGARNFLVAYNVYLNTDKVEIAKKISKAVRNSSGGLRYVKGLGMLVEGQAQVSMNLTNFKATPVSQVVEMIRREASRYGASITHSELIGLIPQQALIDAAVWYLQLEGFSEDQILEYKMNAELAAKQGSGAEHIQFLDDLASGTPTPGGGSAAAYAGAMAAGLVAMVARVTIGKKKYADVEAEMVTAAEQAEELRKRLQDSVAEDSAAFDDVMAAYKLPKNTEEEKLLRSDAIQQATLKAALVPMKVAQYAVEVLNLTQIVTEKGNSNAITDAGTAAALARSAISGASMNIQINVLGLEDDSEVSRLTGQLDRIKVQASELLETIDQAVRDRGQISGLNF